MIEKRFNELYDRAFQRNQKVFSEFLNMEEQSVLKQTYLPCTTFGGYDMAERVVAGFGDEVENDDFPISCLCVSPVSKKFADKLTHRDFLGSLMNLGIKREMLGDIVIADNVGYVFCLEQVKGYIAQSLTRVKHTSVSVKETDTLPDCVQSVPDDSELVVSSCRLDVLICAVYKLSRKEALKLFACGNVFVNSRQTENSSYTVKENDIISVRGFGRFTFTATLRKTKKDRIVVAVKVYK
ncbi:MAG: YlmH/Sll1252 family protein [Eubacteriales bacterium]|nr:YlmH/Sll1252 family protein [Eubacteriales bacterium]